MQSEKKNVLFCIVGMSPAILTETIWALATKEDPIIVDEVYTLTTLSGKNKLEEVMLKKAPKAKKNQWEIFKDKLSKKIKVDLSDKMFLTESILFKGLILDKNKNPIEDIKTNEDNMQVADFFMEYIFPKAHDKDCRIIASVAGGRKTLGILLHSVMGLLARNDDKIYHILVSEPCERVDGFLYPTCAGDFIDKDTKEVLDSKTASLNLLEIPFVSMGKILENIGEKKDVSYRNMIERMNDLTEIEEDTKLKIDIENKSVIVNSIEVKILNENHLAYLYAVMKIKQSKIKDAHYGSVEFEEYFAQVSKTILDSDNTRSYRTQLKKVLEKASISKLVIDTILPYGRSLNVSIKDKNIEIID